MTPPGAETEDDIGDLIARLERRDTEDSEDVSHDLNAVTERLLAFGKALGGDVETVSELPFIQADQISGKRYVRHDPELGVQVRSWFVADQHIGLVSPSGTGKSAFCEIVLRDLTKHDRFIGAYIDNQRVTTARSLYQTVVETAYSAGYSIDLDHYGQIRDGVPWATADTRDAMERLIKRVRSDGKALVLVADDIELLSADVFSPLQIAGNAGVRLFLTATPKGKHRIAEFRGTLDTRLRYYEGIAPFGPDDIAEYIARSLAYFRGEAYDGESPDLFTPGAIKDIHERTGGTPRAVRIDCRELFARAAFIWYQTGQDIDRIRITPELRHQQFGIDI